MITSGTQVKDFQKSLPLPSFRLRAPNSNPFLPSLPASVTGGAGARVEFSWRSPITIKEERSSDFSEMVEKLQRQVERFPTSGAVRVNLAVALSKIGHLSDAEKTLQTAIKIDEKNSYLAKVNLAYLFTQQDRFGEAESIYEKLLSEKPNDGTALLSLAIIALRKNDIRAAEDALKRAAAHDQGGATSHFLLGMVHLFMNDLRGAISALRQATRSDVRNPAMHQALGVVFVLKSELSRAEQEFRAAFALAPNDRATIRALYQTLLTQGKAYEAVDLLKNFLQQNPSDLPAREALALGLFDLKRFSDARFHLQKLLAEGADTLTPEQAARVHENVGLSWWFEGKPSSARSAFLRVIEAYPEHSPIAYENLARLYLSQDNTEAARDVLIRCKSIFKDRIETAVLLGSIYSMTDDVQLAIVELRDCEHSIEKKGLTVPLDLYVNLGFLYSATGRMKESKDISKKGLKTFPDSIMLLNNYAYVCAMLDELDEARAAVKRMSKENVAPERPEWIATRGLLRLKEGDERSGAEHYEQAERLATEQGNREVARRLRQKKHLELARHLIRRKAFDRARTEINQGLAVHVRQFGFESELMRLRQELPA